MTVGELKAVVAYYHQKDVSDFVRGTTDLLMMALNNARRRAELVNDFNQQRVEATVMVSPTTGGSLSTAVLRGTETAVRLKEYITFYRTNSEGDVPLYHHGKKSVAVWAKERIWNDRPRWNEMDVRYPGDDDYRRLRTEPEELYIHGDKIYINPARSDTTEVTIDGVAWMNEYTTDADTDWMTQAGAEYLQWAAVCEINYFTLKLVPGLDGNLAPPERARERALAELVTWDQFQVEQGRQPRGIR
jgi:hypothetical protein